MRRFKYPGVAQWSISIYEPSGDVEAPLLEAPPLGEASPSNASPDNGSSTASLRAGRRSIAPWAYLIANVPLIVVVFLFPHLHVYLWGMLGVGSAGAMIVGMVRNRPTHRMAWVLLICGVSTFAAGDITYDVLTEFLHQSNPFPSIADLFYLATYVLLSAGLVTMVRSRRRRDGDTGPLLDALTITAGLSVLSWVYLIHPYVRAADMPLFTKIVSVAYPLGDILLLCVVARLAFANSSKIASVRLLVTGVVGVLLADSVYGWIQLHGSWKVGGPTDLGWVLFYVCWGAAALHPSMRELTVEQPRRGRALTPATLTLLSIAALLAPALIIWRDMNGIATDAGILAAASAVIFILVMLRLTGLARAQGVNASRELALRKLSERLVTASERSEVWTATVAAISAIGAAGVVGCLVTDATDSNDVIVTATWPDLIGVRVNVAEIDGNSSQRSVALVGGESVAGTSQSTTWTEVELARTDSAHEKLLLAHNASLPLELRSILGAIVAQVSLAIDRVQLASVVQGARNERRFQSMVQYSSDLITLVGANLRIIYQSPAVESVLGRVPNAMTGHLLTEFIHPDDLLTAQAQITKVLTAGTHASARFEYRVARLDGQWRTIDTVVSNLLEEPDIAAIVLNGRDVSDRRVLELELNHRAFHDTLTGLANRELFLDRLTHAMARADREPDPVAVLFLDLDDFKTVNDSLGHPAGDRLLVAVAERIRAATRPGDTVARFGGDEFAVLVESGTMPEAAQAVAARITAALVPTLRVHDSDVAMRASIGIAIGKHPQETPDDLLRDADLAMYLAKHNGKGRFEMYRPDMHVEAVHRLETAAGVRAGLEANQFEVYYQPIVVTHTGVLAGVEALVRWNHPNKGVLSPAEFIPTAETTGLIIPLGRRVLRDATRQAEEWRRSGLVAGDFYVSVNLSVHQLEDPDFVEDVARALKDSGLPPEALVLEITESALVQNLELTLPRLRALTQLGLRLAVDDFGTGYSSFSYLADLPVSVVKIDKSFIDRVTPDPGGTAIVRGVIDLSQALGLTCIAEGVEGENQLAALDDLGCESAQGYLFARPATSADIADTLSRLRMSKPTQVLTPS
jgi:diguanylate cyclase (GGDEF)-like protein/PAS domain S-box-containing protein